MYDRILIPSDGSKGARRGVEYGLDLAESAGAEVYTLYVVDEGVYGETPALSSNELSFEVFEDEGREVLDQVEELADMRGLEVEKEVVRGDPHEEIIKYADENDVDLIVMGIHGVGEHDHPYIGSVTERVMKLSGRKVLPC